MTSLDLGDFIDRYRRALDAFFRGDPEPAKQLYSHRGDASLGNPFRSTARTAAIAMPTRCVQHR